MINVDDRIIRSTLREIGPDALSVWLCLSTFMNAKNTCYPRLKTIQEMTGMGRDKTNKALKVLIDKKIISKNQFKYKVSGKYSNNNYLLLNDQIKFYVDHKKPSTENQLTGVPSTEIPLTVNQSPISINNIISINNKKDCLFSEFEKFHSMYLGSKRKAETEYNEFIESQKATAKMIIPELVRIVTYQNKDYQAKKDSGQFVPNLKHLKNYLKSRQWEFEPAQESKSKPNRPAIFRRKQKAK